MVDALFVEKGGPYFDLLGEAHCWDREREAMTYAGSGPVICHPDCGPWGRLRHMYRGHGHAHAPFAAWMVRRKGGVLEHPAGSQLFDHIIPRFLPKPGDPSDDFCGYTIEVDQCDWGHVARKRTWLYLVGIPRDAIVLPPKREPTHHVSRDAKRARRNGYTLKRTSSQQNRRTPVEFARWLIALAELAGKERAA